MDAKLLNKQKYNKISKNLYYNNKYPEELDIIGEGNSRIAAKIKSECVNNKEERWGGDYYCLKLAKQNSQGYSDGVFQNRKEYNTYYNELKENSKQYFSPILDYNSNFLWVLHPYMEEPEKNVKEFCSKVRCKTHAVDICRENIKSYEGTLYVIDYGFGVNII